MSRLPVAVLAFVLLASPGCGALTVIHDTGATRPLAPFLDVITGDREDGRPAAAPRPDSPPGAGAVLERLLPIRSPPLTPGPVAPRAERRPLTRLLFLVGTDARSRRWLAAHRDRLAALGALGMLVAAETPDDLRAMARLAEGLPLLPASASDLARVLRLRHYPVLITREGIEP